MVNKCEDSSEEESMGRAAKGNKSQAPHHLMLAAVVL